ncbi:hepatitis A virus cellular receptor 1 homolog isoform X1 [Heptranchias perlo]|uniref:hepatitis A virus cellular receptor 1 homolog isoform X1 n=2 Tax=Heptranchias perlo TaxID=212740 RepID=UPI00355AA4B4
MLVTWVVTHLTVLLVLLGPVTFVTGSEVRGVLGQSITLPCTYNVGRNGKTEMCWGRGQCPSMACTDPLIETNGKTVTFTKSSKYHLGGKLEEGDVSLTVNHLGEEDRGWYCCRVHIAGMFNDQKVNFNLVVLEDLSLVMIPPFTDVTHTSEHGNRITSYTNSLPTSPTDRNSTQTPLSTVPEMLVSRLISPILLAARVSVLICFIAITVLLCQWKCKYPTT